MGGTFYHVILRHDDRISVHLEYFSDFRLERSKILRETVRQRGDEAGDYKNCPSGKQYFVVDIRHSGDGGGLCLFLHDSARHSERKPCITSEKKRKCDDFYLIAGIFVSDGESQREVSRETCKERFSYRDEDICREA